MACYSPWTTTPGQGLIRSLSCGQCIGCRLEKSRQWAVRCVHEASLYDHNCYLTLTFDDYHLPDHHSLDHRIFQLFMKRLRKHYPDKTIRYYMAGEYGADLGRPHYHACLFNHDFVDKILHSKNNGNPLYISPTLDKIWQQGFASIGSLTFNSAAYVARYIMKKQTGENAGQHYGNKKPEYNKMSNRPGIGQNWLKKYKSDVYPEGTLIINANKARPPRYYDQQFKKTNPRAYARMIAARATEALERLDDNNNQRLEAKQTVKQAQLSQLKRTLT